MNHLFWGLLFVFLDLNINFGKCTLGLLPDFIGYILMVKGLKALAPVSRRFAKIRPWALAMAVCTGALYGLDLFAASFQLRLLSWSLGLASLAVRLVIGYWIVAGIQNLETTKKRNLQGQNLRLMWTYTAVVSGICHLFSWIPVVGIISAIGALIINLCFLVAFYKSKTLYLEKER